MCLKCTFAEIYWCADCECLHLLVTGDDYLDLLLEADAARDNLQSIIIERRDNPGAKLQ